MTVEACAAIVARGDPDRFAATLAAPRPARAALMVLYAWNLEVARAAWVSAQPLVCEMRLQWWRDALDGPPRAHEVAGPLRELIAARNLPVQVMDDLIAARWWDLARDPHDDQAALWRYLDATGAGLMHLAGLATGARPGTETILRAAGRAAALAAYLQAVPELEARGRIPLVDGRPAAVAALARQGLAALDQARADRAAWRAAGPALVAAWQAGPLLTRAARAPARVAAGTLRLPEVIRRGRLLLAATFGA